MIWLMVKPGKIPEALIYNTFISICTTLFIWHKIAKRTVFHKKDHSTVKTKLNPIAQTRM